MCKKYKMVFMCCILFPETWLQASVALAVRHISEDGNYIILQCMKHLGCDSQAFL